jgi:prophage regulatory protein
VGINALNLSAVIAKTTIQKTAIYAAIKAGTFPAPAKIGERRSAWLESEVDDWLAARFGERSGAAKGRV